MAEVVARRRARGRDHVPVALKRFLPSTRRTRSSSRCSSGGQIAPLLKHPTSRVLDTPRSERQAVQSAMEFLSTGWISTSYGARDRSRNTVVVFSHAEVLEGLGYAHTASEAVSGLSSRRRCASAMAYLGIVHRDISTTTL